VPQAWHLGRNVLQLAFEVRRHGSVGCAKLKALEAENAKLKKLLAESVMDVSTLKEMLGKNF
jgi:hypothetical protein